MCVWFEKENVVFDFPCFSLFFFFLKLVVISADYVIRFNTAVDFTGEFAIQSVSQGDSYERRDTQYLLLSVVC